MEATDVAGEGVLVSGIPMVSLLGGFLALSDVLRI